MEKTKRFCVSLDDGTILFEYDFDEKLSDDECCDRIWDLFENQVNIQKEYDDFDWNKNGDGE